MMRLAGWCIAAATATMDALLWLVFLAGVFGPQKSMLLVFPLALLGTGLLFLVLDVWSES